MKALQDLAFWFTFLHIMVLAIYNKYRTKKIIKYISIFKGNVLSDKQFYDLLNQYTSFFSIKFYPDSKRYAEMYVDEDFYEFYSQSKRIMIYLYVASATGFIFAFISSI